MCVRVCERQLSGRAYLCVETASFCRRQILTQSIISTRLILHFASLASQREEFIICVVARYLPFVVLTRCCDCENVGIIVQSAVFGARGAELENKGTIMVPTTIGDDRVFVCVALVFPGHRRYGGVRFDFEGVFHRLTFHEFEYFLIGIIYDVIVEPPSVGSTTDEHGHSRPVRSRLDPNTVIWSIWFTQHRQQHAFVGVKAQFIEFAQLASIISGGLHAV